MRGKRNEVKVDSKFMGFTDPKENWSKLPHELIGQLPTIETIGEMKVILYVLRHTWGYHDTEKRITLDEFMRGRKTKEGKRIDSGTGLSEPTLRSGIEKAVEHGFLTVETDDSDKGRIKKIYSLTQKDLPPDPQETLPRTEKDTKKETKKYSGDSKSESPDTPHTTPDEKIDFDDLKSANDGKPANLSNGTAVADPRVEKIEQSAYVSEQCQMILPMVVNKSTKKGLSKATSQIVELGIPKDKLDSYFSYLRSSGGEKLRADPAANWFLIWSKLRDWKARNYPPITHANLVQSGMVA